MKNETHFQIKVKTLMGFANDLNGKPKNRIKLTNIKSKRFNEKV